MIREIGTKIYYNNKNGESLEVIRDCKGHVSETTFEQDLNRFDSLKSVDIQDISVIRFKHGEYGKLSEGSKSVKINLSTKKPIFSY